MKSIVTMALLTFFALGSLTAEGHAGWKIRGWYSPKRAVQCKMTTVVVPSESGKKVVRKIRVCR